jgi:hypothetical protein
VDEAPRITSRLKPCSRSFITLFLLAECQTPKFALRKLSCVTIPLCNLVSSCLHDFDAVARKNERPARINSCTKRASRVKRRNQRYQGCSNRLRT